MIPAMGRESMPPATPDLVSTALPVGEKSPATTKQVPSSPHVLPKDLPNALKHLSDGDLDLLIAASLDEAMRRGRPPPSVQVDKFATTPAGTNKTQKPEVVSGSLTRGQVNAVRAAFKAGVKPSLIARQFGISQSEVRKVLASEVKR
jgi:hypothetical protein